jgi:hypothetical protein
MKRELCDDLFERGSTHFAINGRLDMGPVRVTVRAWKGAKL